MRHEMKIKILQATDPIYWYADKIDEVYEVARYDGDRYIVTCADESVLGSKRPVLKADCCIVGNTHLRILDLRALIEEALEASASHHDRWYLENIADLLGVAHESEGISP